MSPDRVHLRAGGRGAPADEGAPADDPAVPLADDGAAAADPAVPAPAPRTRRAPGTAARRTRATDAVFALRVEGGRRQLAIWFSTVLPA